MATNALPQSGVLHTTFWATVAVQTIGNVKNGLPPPRIYAGIFVLWFILGLISGGGKQPAKFAGGIALLVLLTVMLGKAGTTTFAWLGNFGETLGLTPPKKGTTSSEPSKPPDTVI